MSVGRIFEKVRISFRRAILRVSPPCQVVVHILSASLDRKLTLRERFIMKLHLAACKPCVRYLDQSRFVNDALNVMNNKEVSELYSGSLREETRARITEALRFQAASY